MIVLAKFLISRTKGVDVAYVGLAGCGQTRRMQKIKRVLGFAYGPYYTLLLSDYSF